ncbi:uncharacterized protein LOC133713870 [Rosa rugosa]|uniref:uncharacterized protein LOC133713870 n=1 Tax=Rosa rugosa TaxID=74645 RepID=UPI002B403C27|nr:uncharacterized protein LOC133713870 [Rosa rugosa]
MDRWSYSWENPMGYEQPPQDQPYAPSKSSIEELFAQFKAISESVDPIMEQFKASLLQEQPPTTLYLQEPFFDQVEPISREEVHIKHLEQESFMQIDDYSDVDVQESELGYESFNASEVRDYTSEEWVQYWKSKLPNGGEIFEDDSDEEDVFSSEEDAEFEVMHHNPLFIEAVLEHDSKEEDDLSSEEDAEFEVIHHNPLFIVEDAEFEVIHHNPLFIEVDIPMEEESPSILCDDEEIEEPRTFLPPTSMEIHHELPKVDCRILSTYVIHENVENKVLLPLNPPLSGQCFYNEVMDWKGNEPLALNLSHHLQELLPPIVPMCIISTSLEKEKARIAPRRNIEKKGKIKKLHFCSPIRIFIVSSWSCLYDTSKSPLAPNNRVVALEKYPP